MWSEILFKAYEADPSSFILQQCRIYFPFVWKKMQQMNDKQFCSLTLIFFNLEVILLKIDSIPNPSFPSLHSFQLSPPLLSIRSTPPPFPFRKGQPSKGQQPKMPKQDTIRQGERPHLEAGQGNLIGGKGSQEQAKESKTQALPLLSPIKH